MGDTIITNEKNIAYPEMLRLPCQTNKLTSERRWKIEAEDKYRGPPAAVELGLTSNPLYLILEGHVEIYYMKHDHTFPAVVAGPGDTFGEFEIDEIKSGLEGSWRRYIARARAGFRTVHLGSRFGNIDLWRDVFDTQEDEMPESATTNSQSISAGIMWETFRCWFSDFRVRLALINRKLVSDLFQQNSEYKLKFYKMFADHSRKLMRLRPEVYGEPPRDQTEHFLEDILPMLEDGEIPVLVDCQAYDEMDRWWREFHKYVKDNHHQLGALNLPFNFFVPADRDRAKSVFLSTCDRLLLPPAISCGMLRTITSRRSADVNGFISRLHKATKERVVKYCLCKPTFRGDEESLFRDIDAKTYLYNRRKNQLVNLWGDDADKWT
ncbi:MAG: hypothetical protein ACFFDP_02685 [Promethearchaeota archaeon]